MKLRERIKVSAPAAPGRRARRLLDRGLLVREENEYRPAGPIEALEVPETLHALIAARLDGLTPGERGVVQDGSVLGKTFTPEGIAAITGRGSVIMP